MRRGSRWTVRLTAIADRDLDEIDEWTVRRFGVRQARTYAATLRRALRALTAGPGTPGARARPDVGANLYTLHAARSGRRARHSLVFRVDRGEPGTIEVLRVLHDAMDLARHIPPVNAGEEDDQP